MWPLLAQQNLPITSMDKMTWTEPSSGQWPAKVWGKTTCALCTGHWAGYRVQCACRGVIGPIKGRLFQLIHQTIWLKLARQDIFFLLHLIVNSQFSFLRVQLFSQWMWPAKRGKARQACWYQCGYQNQNYYKYWNGNAVWQRQTTRIIRATSIL